MSDARTVLVVDDDPDLRDLVAFKLSRAGYEVLTAEDGETGLALAQEQRPDLVILDVMMPGLSGIDVLRVLRMRPQTSGLAVIMLTARAQEGDTETAFLAGADDYVVKPFSPRELVRRAEAVLARMRA